MINILFIYSLVVDVSEMFAIDSCQDAAGQVDQHTEQEEQQAQVAAAPSCHAANSWTNAPPAGQAIS